MAKARTLDRRRRSISGIRKITRTMELISTAQFKRAMTRATTAAAYTERVTALVGHLARSGLEVSHPLLEPRPEPKLATLLVLTGNRGMCAGYNAGVIRQGVARYRELATVASDVALEVSGKRGISAFRFRKIPIDVEFTHFEDKPSFAEVDVLAERYLQDFTAGKLDRLDVAYTRFKSVSHQQAVVETLLPFHVGQVDNLSYKGHETQYEFLPSAAGILDEVVPMSFRVRLFKCFLDAAVSEQVARMVAMKAATENADEMISHLSMAYNRARQGQITNELLEIIGGADALNG
ncbi:MAG: ATP synthase F1 subunit gamma [Pirellulales bacterium]|nr:ATP synthase F1 subunit gamma [Pirellulales bacterium]